MRGTMAPSTRPAFRAEDLTTRSLTGSPPTTRLSSHLIWAPMLWRISKTPSRVGLVPTLRSRISEPGAISAATAKKAALDMSPGTTHSCAWTDCPAPMETRRSWISSLMPAAVIIRSVWSRDLYGSSTAVTPSA